MATIITGFKATSDLTSQRLVVDLADKIALLDINSNPATFVSKRLNSKKAKQPKVSWLTDEMRPDSNQIAFTTAQASTVTALTVDNVEYFAVGDLWQVFDSYEIMRVAGVTAGTGLAIVEFDRNYPGVSAGEHGEGTATADNDWLLRIGNVNEEGAAAPTIKMVKEVQLDNYTQILRTPFELTETELASMFAAEPDLPYMTRKKGIEHALDIERIFFWGIPSATTGDNSKPQRSAGGLWHYLNTNGLAANLVLDAQLDQLTFMDWLRKVFRYGSSEKWLFAAPMVLSAIEHWIVVTGGLQVFPGSGDFGFNARRWITPHGIINITNHKLLEGPNPGTVGSWAFLVDMEEVSYRALRDTHLKTNIQANDEDRYGAEYLTELSFNYGNLKHHGAIYGVTSFT